MKITLLESSNINAAAYDNDVLYLQFHSGKPYCYPGVPESLFKDMIAAPSAGKFFHQNIKKTFPYEPVSPADDPFPEMSVS